MKSITFNSDGSVKVLAVYHLYIKLPQLKRVSFDAQGEEVRVTVYNIKVQDGVYNGTSHDETRYLEKKEAREVYKSLLARGAKKTLPEMGVSFPAPARGNPELNEKIKKLFF